MKGRLFLLLFALPFAGVGCWAGWSLGSTFHDAWQMQQWRAAEARITEAGYHSHSGDDSTTYEAYAKYSYRVDGRDYSNDRVGLSGGADNIGSYQQDTGRRLRQAAEQGATVTVYYDPANPADSIIDRDIRWGMVGFKSIFLVAFGGVGFGLLFFTLRAKPPKDAADPAYSNAPWLRNDKWQTPEIRSGAKSAMIGAWVFAAFWNLISMPLPFLLVDEVKDDGNFAALLGLVFPLVGVALLVWAIRRTLEWRRFGATPVTLDPFPGAIGGHVGGTIDLRVPYRANAAFDVTLTAIRSSVSGSGKNRSRSEKALWQDDQAATADPGPLGTRLTFRFDVPEDLPASDAVPDSRSSNLWRLNVAADLPGIDLDRSFEIPVYPTGARSTALPESRLREARQREDHADDVKVRQQLNVGYGLEGRQMHFPAGRNLLIAVFGFLFGAIFGGVGWFLLVQEGELFMGLVFASVGTLAALGMVYKALNSLTVTLSAGELTAVRRILGFTVSRKSVRLDAIRRLSKSSAFQTQAGGKHVMHYRIHVHDDAGNKLTVAEGLKGEGDANAAIRLIEREFGIGADAGLPDDEVDVLAADR